MSARAPSDPVEDADSPPVARTVAATAMQWLAAAVVAARGCRAPERPHGVRAKVVGVAACVVCSACPVAVCATAVLAVPADGEGNYTQLLCADPGVSAETQIVDANDGRCVPVPGRDAYTWAYQVPCKTSLGGRTFVLDTTKLPNGPHHLQVLLEDAAGNGSLVVDRTVQVSNAVPAPPEGGPAGRPKSPSGTANGSGASESAQLRLDGAGVLSRPFARSAFWITGRLSAPSGSPIAGASLDVSEQVEGSVPSLARLIARTSTHPDGTFAVRVPQGASRLILIGYRAFSSDPSYTARDVVREQVGAGVRLRVSPRRTATHGTITLSGVVRGPVPGSGVIVELLVRYLGHWEPFRTPRTDARGRFRVSYAFQGALGRFPFRALVPAAQAGFPYAQGQSASVTVSTG